MDKSNVRTGVFRRDIEIIRQNPLMLFDRQSDAYYRISEKTARIVCCMSESLPVSEFRERLLRMGIEVSEAELLQLISFLRQNDLLEPEYGEISAKRQQRITFREKSRFLRWSSAYMYFRLPPWHPENCFKRIAPWVSFLASGFFVFLLMIPAATGYLLVLRELPQVKNVFADTLSWAGAAKYLAAILLLKIIHEAAHSLAAIRFNCRVRGIGVGFMLFYPRLYTDTTDSWQLPRKKRLLIDAAGVIAELLIGGIAALLYFYLPPGAWQSTMFYIFAVSTISTLLVNGNPCIRYDGYYILCDLTGIDNLMSRSGEYVKRCWRYYLLRLGTKPAEKRGWFLFLFGFASFIYRIFLYTAIIMVIYHKFIRVVAVILLLLEIFTIFIYPCYREFRTVKELSGRKRKPAGIILFAAVAAAVAGVLFIPLNWSVELPGLLVPEKRSLIVVAESGYLTASLPEFPQEVKAGETLFTLESDTLLFAREKLQHVLAMDKKQYRLESLDEKSFSSSKVTLEKIASDEKALAELTRRQDNLSVTAPADGVFVAAPLESFRRGRFLPRGMAVGEVVSRKNVIHAYADDQEAAGIRCGDQAKVYVSDSEKAYMAVVTKVDAVALPLKDSPLLQVYGGTIPMYQSSDGESKYHSVRLYYQLELTFTGEVPLTSGRRVRCEIGKSQRLYDIISRTVTGVFRREF